MIDFTYLSTGLCGLAHAHRAGSMAGHLGASLMAGYFFGEDVSDLESPVYRGVEAELDRIRQGEEAFWFSAKKAGVTVDELFLPMPEEEPEPGKIEALPEALAQNIGQLRSSGHNVIFAAIALRALRDHPEMATPSVINGLTRLIVSFNSTGPGQGYYGKERGQVQGSSITLPEEDLPSYDDMQGMVEAVVDELISSASLQRRGFGGLWHIINHAAALTELSRFGYHDLARSGIPAQRTHIRLWRTVPDVPEEFGPMIKAGEDPRTPGYWAGSLKRDEARLTHRIKTLYGFFTILKFIEDPKKRALAEDSFLFLMA